MPKEISSTSNYLAQKIYSSAKPPKGIKSIDSAFTFCKIDRQNLKISYIYMDEDADKYVLGLKDPKGNLVEIDLDAGTLTFRDTSGKHRPILEATSDTLRSIIPYLEKAAKKEPHSSYYEYSEDLVYQISLLEDKASSDPPPNSEITALKSFFKDDFIMYPEVDPENGVGYRLCRQSGKKNIPNILILYPETGKTKWRTVKVAEDGKLDSSETPLRQITKKELEIIRVGIRKQIKTDFEKFGKKCIRDFIKKINSLIIEKTENK